MKCASHVLASYACDPSKTRGRVHAEKFDPADSNPFLKDRYRVINSVAFRRLEYKTQVFVNHIGDHYRTRLTHSLEVAQIGRNIARHLGLNEDLTETISLAHDLGHPPFGHAGEDGLNEAAKDFGGFDHNVQTVKILTQLEQRHAEFDGLNLTWESLEGLAKHNGPFAANKAISITLSELSAKMDLYLYAFPSLEAQISALADDIAYCNHDIDDGIRAGMLKMNELRQIEQIAAINDNVRSAWPGINETQEVNETVIQLGQYMLHDLVGETKKKLSLYKISSVEDIRKHKHALAMFSPEVEEIRRQLKELLMQKVYRHYRVNRMTIKGKQIIHNLFNHLLERPECLPTDWYIKTRDLDKSGIASVVIDYIAGMTDRFAIEEHTKLFNPNYF